MSTYPPFYAYPSAPTVVRAVPNPPRLHWGWVFGLSVVTLGFFGMVWMIVQAAWVRKVRGRSKTLPWTIVYASILPAVYLCAIAFGIIGTLLHVQNVVAIANAAEPWVRIALFALFLIATYTLRNELCDDPIDLPLTGVMTFFFGAVYFQYHLFDYEVSDAVHQFRGPLRTDLEVPPPASPNSPA